MFIVVRLWGRYNVYTTDGSVFGQNGLREKWIFFQILCKQHKMTGFHTLWSKMKKMGQTPHSC